MNLISNFKKDESGAVTVDWVVLTAAIVGIGMSVVAAVSTGVKSASEEVDCGMSVASNFNFSFNKSEAKTMDDYITGANCGATLAEEDQTEENIGILYAALDAAAADSPEGYSFNGNIDPNSGYPVYDSIELGQTGPTVIIGGVESDATTYYEENSELALTYQ